MGPYFGKAHSAAEGITLHVKPFDRGSYQLDFFLMLIVFLYVLTDMIIQQISLWTTDRTNKKDDPCENMGDARVW